MFRQDRTNPSTAVSNWRGRHDSTKGWPSSAVSSWLNGGLFGGFNSITATGGTEADYTDSTDGFLYRSHTFTSSGTFEITANPEGLTFDVLVVGAGGGSVAIYNRKSGGGGGEALTTTGQTGNVESYTVTIAAATVNDGDDSTFVSAPGTTSALTGRGGDASGSSGGQSGNGNSGGSSDGTGGGGGGGSGATGSNQSGQIGGNGGAGTTNTQFQAGSTTFGGGGGGGSANGTISAARGSGGSGGGGDGGVMGWYNSGIPIGTNGDANTGGGAGGHGDQYGGPTPTNYSGGSGIVIVRYALEDVS